MGNLLGAGDASRARIAARLAITSAVIESTFLTSLLTSTGVAMAGLLFGLRTYIVQAFTTDSATVDLAAQILRLVAAFHVIYFLPL